MPDRIFMDDPGQGTGSPGIEAQGWHQGHLGLKPETGRDQKHKIICDQGGCITSSAPSQVGGAEL